MQTPHSREDQRAVLSDGEVGVGILYSPCHSYLIIQMGASLIIHRGNIFSEVRKQTIVKTVGQCFFGILSHDSACKEVEIVCSCLHLAVCNLSRISISDLSGY